MKALIKLLIISLLAVNALNLNAQIEGKFGHVNSQELLSTMPESDSAQSQIEALANNYELQLEDMQVELNKKYEEYLQNRDSYAALIRQTKEAEIAELNQRIQQFEAVAQQELQNQRNELLRPIIEKANKAIREVAEDNDLLYVFDISQGNPVYFSTESVNILPLVKEKLGLK